MKVYLQREAKQDLEDSAIWYRDQVHDLGFDFVDEVLSCLDRIEDNPLAYPVVHVNVRRAVIQRFPFCIYYLVDQERISVVAVLHGSRDPSDWKTRI